MYCWIRQVAAGHTECKCYWCTDCIGRLLPSQHFPVAVLEWVSAMEPHGLKDVFVSVRWELKDQCLSSYLLISENYLPTACTLCNTLVKWQIISRQWNMVLQWELGVSCLVYFILILGEVCVEWLSEFCEYTSTWSHSRLGCRTNQHFPIDLLSKSSEWKPCCPTLSEQWFPLSPSCCYMLYVLNRGVYTTVTLGKLYPGMHWAFCMQLGISSNKSLIRLNTQLLDKTDLRARFILHHS